MYVCTHVPLYVCTYVIYSYQLFNFKTLLTDFKSWSWFLINRFLKERQSLSNIFAFGAFYANKTKRQLSHR